MILAAFVVVFMVTAILSGLETGVYSLERVRLQVSAARGDRTAKRLLEIVASPAMTVCALLLAINVAHYGLAYLADRLVISASPDLDGFGRRILDTLLLGPVLFVLGDLLPKNVFMRVPGGLMRTFHPFLAFVSALFRPLSWPIVKLLEPREAPGAGTGTSSIFDRGSIHYLLTLDDEAANLTDPQREVAERVLALRSLRVQDRLIPLRRTSAVPAGATAAEIVAEGARSGHSRLPVFSPDGSRFDGYVSVIDAATAPDGFVLSEHMHELPAVPCDLPVTAALYRLQRTGRPIAAVLSPDGRTTLGIIAVSDIVAALFRV